MKPRDFQKRLQEAIDRKDQESVEELVDRIDPTVFEAKEAAEVLQALRSARAFESLEKAAATFVIGGPNRPEFQRQWAQALLEQRRLETVRPVLEQLKETAGADPQEGPEIRGLLGRAYKELYIAKGQATDLRSAIHYYSQDWSTRRDSVWHGSNLLSLLQRAKRDSVQISPSKETATQIAERLLSVVTQNPNQEAWDYASALVASLSLEKLEESKNWLKRYVEAKDVDAFSLAGTIRQLREVCQLDEVPNARPLLMVLEQALLHTGGTVNPSVDVHPNDLATFERVYGGEGPTAFRWFDKMLSKVKSVARVVKTGTNIGVGTGFLVDGGKLREQWEGSTIFVTNHHVVNQHPHDAEALRPEDASAEFTRLEDCPRVQLGELLYYSPPHLLDVSLLRIEPPDGARPLQTTSYCPNAEQGLQKQRAFVMGHPHGGELAVSFYGNRIDSYRGPYVQYKSPTEKGNSGSPVFNEAWEVFALHHRTLPKERLNRGIQWREIKAEIMKSS